MGILVQYKVTSNQEKDNEMMLHLLMQWDKLDLEQLWPSFSCHKEAIAIRIVCDAVKHIIGINQGSSIES